MVEKFCFIHVHAASESATNDQKTRDSTNLSQHVIVSRLLTSAAPQGQNTVTAFLVKNEFRAQYDLSLFENYHIIEIV